jgi:hypothetical protein
VCGKAAHPSVHGRCEERAQGGLGADQELVDDDGGPD